MSDSDSVIAAASGPTSESLPAGEPLVVALAAAAPWSEWAWAGAQGQATASDIDALSPVPVGLQEEAASPLLDGDVDPLVGIPAVEIAALEGMHHDAADWPLDHNTMAIDYGAPLDHVEWQFVALMPLQ